MKKILYLLLLCLTFSFFYNCKKNEEPAVLTTAPVTDITASTAISGGNITSEGGSAITAYGVCWNTTVNPKVTDSKTTDGTGIAQFVSNMTYLQVGTTYHVRAYATNSFGTGYGEDVSFTTLGHAPIATTETATEVTGTTVVLNGTVNANDLPTAINFEYGTTTSYGSKVVANQSPLRGNVNMKVSAFFYGLAQGTTYHFRIKAENSLGTVYGGDLTFTTLDFPTFSTATPVSITNNSAVSGGNITFDGGSAITDRGVCWSISENPTVECPKTSDGAHSGQFTSTLTELMPNTTYYVRAYALNSLGYSYANQLVFKTLP